VSCSSRVRRAAWGDTASRLDQPTLTSRIRRARAITAHTVTPEATTAWRSGNMLALQSGAEPQLWKLSPLPLEDEPLRVDADRPPQADDGPMWAQSFPAGH